MAAGFRYEFDSFEFDEKTRTLKKGGDEIDLRPQAASLLLIFLQRPGELLAREELLKEAWGGAFVHTQNLDVQLTAIKKALNTRSDGNSYIENKPRRGFQFVAPVRKFSLDEEAMAAKQQILNSVNSFSRQVSPDIAQAVAAPGRSKGLQRIALVAPAVLLLLLLGALVSPRRASPRLRVGTYTALTHDGMEKDEGLIMSDGDRVYFREDGPEGKTFEEVSVNGGEPNPVAWQPGFVIAFDVSHETKEFLASSSTSDPDGHSLWTVPMQGGIPRRIGNLRATDAKWSPNQKLIAFTTDRELYVANSDGTGIRKLATLPGSPNTPRWSPDGKRLRCTVNSFEGVEHETWNALWEVGIDGSNLHRLLAGWNNPPRECCGVWTSDGEFFVFQSVRDGRSDLWALPESHGLWGTDVGVPFRLTSTLQGYSSPAISADGQHIFALGSDKRGELARYDFKWKEFVPFLGGINATWVIYSKSGRYVAYIRYPDLTVWRANSDGTAAHQVTFPPFEADGLSWSPDETMFAMRGRNPGGPWNMYMVPAAGGQPEAINPGPIEQAIPTWSADSKLIAFGDVPERRNEGAGNEVIHVMTLSDRSVTELNGSNGMWTPRWSPNGRFLSAVTIKGLRLMLYDFRTRTWRSTKAEMVNNPTWSSDSKYIFFDTLGHNRSLSRLSVADGEVQMLVRLDGRHDLAWWWSGVAPDNSPLMLSNRGSSEIFSLTLESR